MWKLIYILIIVFIVIPQKKEKYIYIIVDDCKNWRLGPHNNPKDHFFFSKGRANGLLISFNHGWIDPRDKLSTEMLTISQIMNKEPIYTSTLDDEAWHQLLQVPNQRFFILRPDDFCSDKRFIHDFTFVLYEVRINMDREE
jgi:hypothetical protein